MRFKRDTGAGPFVVSESGETENEIAITRAVSLPYSALKFRFSRSSGPGGQNVNKVATKVELLFDPAALRGLAEVHRERLNAGLSHRLDSRGILHIVADESRSQWSNRESAVAKLVATLREVLRERKMRRPTSPTSGSRVHRAFTKVRRSKVKRLRGRVSTED